MSQSRKSPSYHSWAVKSSKGPLPLAIFDGFWLPLPKLFRLVTNRKNCVIHVSTIETNIHPSRELIH